MLLIFSSFVPFRSSDRDDSDVGSPPGVYHHQQIALNPGSYGNKSPFIGVGFVIRNCYSKVVVEHRESLGEAHSVFCEICLRLRRVPFEAHLSIVCT